MARSPDLLLGQQRAARRAVSFLGGPAGRAATAFRLPAGAICAGAFSGKVGTGFPSENATT
jgi:hypothetical protein